MKKLYIVLSAFLFIQQLAFAQTYNRNWVKNDTASSIQTNTASSITDIRGNTYAIIYSPFRLPYERFVVEKINTSGKIEWKTIYKDSTFAANIHFEIKAITADSLGDIYLAAQAGDAGDISRIITLGYYPDGNLKFQNRFNDGDNASDMPLNVFFTPDKFVLVTGKQTIGKTNQILFLKINLKGTTKFVKRFTLKSSYPLASCLDKSGNIIVVGTTYDSLSMIWKFNNEGSYLWSNVFARKGKSEFVQVETSHDDDIYAYGHNYGTRDIVIGYESNGFQRSYVRGGMNSGKPFSVNASGVSWFSDSTSNGWGITKYINGTKLNSVVFIDSAAKKYDDNIQVLTDKDGSVFIAGIITYESGKYSTIVKFSSDGKQVYKDVYYAPNLNYTQNLGIDSGGNIYSANYKLIKTKPGDPNYFLTIIKYKRSIQTFASKTSSAILNNLLLYPNPVVSNINLDFTTSSPSKNYKLIISDVSGNVVLIKQLNNAEKLIHFNVDVSSLKTGVYTASITDGFSNVSGTFFEAVVAFKRIYTYLLLTSLKIAP